MVEETEEERTERIYKYFANHEQENRDKFISKCQKEADKSTDKDLVYLFWQNKNIDDKAKIILIKFPLYYDKSKIWYFYSRTEKKWSICDECDIIASIKKFFEPAGYSKPQIRAELLNSLKDQSRINKPEDISPDWLHFGDGLYNIKTKETKSMNSEIFSLIKVPHNLGKSTDTPIIDAKIISWVGKDQYKLFVQICAYCMLKNYPFARFFIFYGTGADGKSTAGNFITNLIGFENSCDIDLDQLSVNRFESQKLYQKTLAICGEVDYKLLKNTRKLKGVTGNDSMTIEFKNKNPFSYKNFAKLIWYANGLPPTYDKTEGFYRRSVIIKFPNKFKECHSPLKDITEQEYENFCLKCTEYLQEMLLKNKFNEKTIEEKLKKYEELSNPIIGFLEKNIKQGRENDFILAVNLLNSYNKYAKQHAFRSFSARDFYPMVEAEELELKRTRFYRRENEEVLDLIKYPNIIYSTQDVRLKCLKGYKFGTLGLFGTPILSQYTSKETKLKVESHQVPKSQDNIKLKDNPLIHIILNIMDDNKEYTIIELSEFSGLDENLLHAPLGYLKQSGQIIEIKKGIFKRC